MITKEIYSFLTDLAANNNKAWFDANRHRYEPARADFIDFVQAVIIELGTRMDLSGIDPKKCVFRINRDVRFSKNKDPYKSNFACGISPTGKNGMMPMGLYIGIQPGENFVGLGLYEPQPDQLKAIRQEIDYNFEAWQKIVEAPDFKTYFGTVQGERLKTTPKGYEATNPALHWLQLKQFYVGHTLSEKELMAPNIVAHLGKVFDAAQPLCQFLADAVASV